MVVTDPLFPIVTLPKTDIAPENQCLEDEPSF